MNIPKINKMRTCTVFMKLASLLCFMSIFSCTKENELVVITGRLPIKSSYVYLTGSATPAGWEIVNPTPVSPMPDNRYVFVYEGVLRTGEFKASTKTGAWTVPFIRPETDGVGFGRDGLGESPFIQSAGDVDDWTWKVNETGIYRLTFNLNAWTFKAEWVEEYDEPEPERDPVPAAALYIVGNIVEGAKDFTVVGGTPMIKDETDPYVFWYEGNLKGGKDSGYMKIATSIDYEVGPDGDEGLAWGQKFVRYPALGNCDFGLSGLSESEIAFEKDDGIYKNSYWHLTASGKFRITVNIRKWTIKIEPKADGAPIEASEIWLTGTSMDNDVRLSSVEDYIFEYEGTFKQGTLKIFAEENFAGAPSIHPKGGSADIPGDGFAAQVFAWSESDDVWNFVNEGRYKLTVNLFNWTLAVERLGAGGDVPEPINASKMFATGTASPLGTESVESWMGHNIYKSEDNPYLFVYNGWLNKGTFFAFTESMKIVCPQTDAVSIGKSGLSSMRFVEGTGTGCNKWNITEEGIYRISFDLLNWTVEAEWISGLPSKGETIHSSALYLYGTVFNGSWPNILNSYRIERTAGNVYTFEGDLVAGQFKAFVDYGGNEIPFIRPASDVNIVRNDIYEVPFSADFTFTTGSSADVDTKWTLDRSGKYRIVFDLDNWAITVTAISDAIDAEDVSISGSGVEETGNFGIYMSFDKTDDDPYVFTLDCNLIGQSGKMITLHLDQEKDGNKARALIPASKSNVSLVAGSQDIIEAGGASNGWFTTDLPSGHYRLTVDLREKTLNVESVQ